MTLDRKSEAGGNADRRALYLGAGIAIPFAVLVWAVLLGTLFWRV